MRTLRYSCDILSIIKEIIYITDLFADLFFLFLAFMYYNKCTSVYVQIGFQIMQWSVSFQ